MVSFQPPPPIQPQTYQSQPLPTQGWTPPQSSAPPQSPPLFAASFDQKRRMGLATIALVLGFVSLALMIHLSYAVVTGWHIFAVPPLPRIVFGPYGIEFFFGLCLVAVTVVLAGIAMTMAFRNPAGYAGRGRSLAAILMGILSTFVVVSLFSYRRMQYRPSFSTTTYTPSTYRPSPSPTPSVSYARDFIKPTLGNFTLIKFMNRDDVRKISSGEMASVVSRANDVAAGAYRSPASQNLSLIVSSYANTSTPADLVNAMQQDMQGSEWSSVRTVPRTNGKRVEGEMSKGGALVVWNNGYWLFIVYGPNTSDAAALADAVGY